MRTYKFTINEEIVNCDYCPMVEPNITGGCQFDYPGFDGHRIDFKRIGRPEWCPLVEVGNEAAKNDN